MNEPVRIREFQAGDIDRLIALFNGAVREVASRDYDPGQIEAWAPATADRQDWLTRRSRRPTFVAERGADVAGFSDLEPGGRIDMMFVHSRHQGRGVAHALLQHIQGLARSQGLRALTTDASITARPFFERNGFVVVRAQDVELRGRSFRNYKMAKSL